MTRKKDFSLKKIKLKKNVNFILPLSFCFFGVLMGWFIRMRILIVGSSSSDAVLDLVLGSKSRTRTTPKLIFALVSKA